MTTTINASTSSGLVNTADTSGILQLQTASTAALTIDANQRTAFVAGTAALPAITTDGDTNTGIYFPAADTIAFSEGGAESMRIDSSGNVGIGTSSPASFDATGRKLVVGTGSGDQGMTIYTGTGNSNIFFASGTTGSQAYNGYIQYNQSSNSMLFGVNAGVERMRIDSSGKLLLNTTSLIASTGGQLNIAWDGSNYWGIAMQTTYATGSGVGSYFMNFFNSSASSAGRIELTGATTVSYVTSSDYRLKENVAPITGALAKVAQLKPVTYKWKVDGSDGEGFIAHELAEVCPSAVSGEKDAVETYIDEEGNEQTRIKPQGIDTSFLVATLTAAIQELKSINDTQAETINALTARIVAIEQR